MNKKVPLSTGLINQFPDLSINPYLSLTLTTAEPITVMYAAVVLKKTADDKGRPIAFSKLLLMDWMSGQLIESDKLTLANTKIVH